MHCISSLAYTIYRDIKNRTYKRTTTPNSFIDNGSIGSANEIESLRIGLPVILAEA